MKVRKEERTPQGSCQVHYCEDGAMHLGKMLCSCAIDLSQTYLSESGLDANAKWL